MASDSDADTPTPLDTAIQQDPMRKPGNGSALAIGVAEQLGRHFSQFDPLGEFAEPAELTVGEKALTFAEKLANAHFPPNDSEAEDTEAAK
jgi:hypothetical protein